MKNILTALQWTIIFIEIVGLAIAFSAAEQEKSIPAAAPLSCEARSPV